MPRRRYPQVRRTFVDYQDLLDDPIRSTRWSSRRRRRPIRHSAAVAALDAGKHVLVEKPLAASSEEIDRIEAARGDRVVMVGHTFVYNPAVQVNPQPLGRHR